VERAVRRAVRDRARLARPARAQRPRGPRQPACRHARRSAFRGPAPVRARVAPCEGIHVMLARGGRPVHVPESATHTSMEESVARH